MGIGNNCGLLINECNLFILKKERKSMNIFIMFMK